MYIDNPGPFATALFHMIEQGQTFKNSFFKGDDDVTLQEAHSFNTGIFKIVDFTVFRVMKLVVKLVHFITLFALAFVTDFFKFIDQDLGVGLGMFIYDVIGNVLNLIVSLVSMIIMRADVRNLIPRTNYFDGKFRIHDLDNLDTHDDEFVARWFYAKK